MHITPRQAFETFPKAPSPTQPLDPDQVWARVLAYNQAHNPQAASELRNGPGEAATSPEASTDDMAAQHGIPPTDTPTLTVPTTQPPNDRGIPDQLRVSKDGVVRVCSYGLYIGLRCKNRKLYATVTDDPGLVASARKCRLRGSLAMHDQTFHLSHTTTREYSCLCPPSCPPSPLP